MPWTAAPASPLRGRERSCWNASLVSDSSSQTRAAASRISRASPIWPCTLTKSATLLSRYCASRRVRTSSPSAQDSGNARPLTVTTTWPIGSDPSCLSFEHLADLGERRVDPGNDRRRRLLEPPVLGGAFGGQADHRIAVAEARHGFEPGHRALQHH